MWFVKFLKISAIQSFATQSHGYIGIYAQQPIVKQYGYNDINPRICSNLKKYAVLFMSFTTARKPWFFFLVYIYC